MTDKYVPKPGHRVRFDGSNKVSTVIANVDESFIPNTTIIRTNGWHGWVFRDKLEYVPRHSHRYNAYYDDPAAPEYQFTSPQHSVER